MKIAAHQAKYVWETPYGPVIAIFLLLLAVGIIVLGTNIPYLIVGGLH